MTHSDRKKNVIIFIGFALVFAVIFITMTRNSISFKKEKANEEFHSTSPVDNTSYILPKELHKKIIQEEEKLFIIDIRNHENYLIEHIKNSVNIPIENLIQEYSKINPQKTIIIVGTDYSEKETLSELFDLLTSKGFEDLHVLSGGMSAWKEEFFPTISVGDLNSIEDISKINYLNPLQLDIAIKNDYPTIIIDIRTKNEFAQGHIPKAINIPANELERRSEEIQKTKEIVIYSESELKDFQMAVKMYDLGYYATYILEEGLEGWKSRNLEIVQ